MDVQGSQYHLLTDEGDWGRSTDVTPGPSLGHTLAALWSDLATHGSMATFTPWEYDATQRVLRLTRETPLFRRAGRNDPVDPATRRGAGRDGYGNWFWISPDRRCICWRPVRDHGSTAWWSVDALEESCTCAAATGVGGFTGTCTCPPSELVLQGLCVTTHHYLLAGYLSPSERGLLVFDLQAGGDPLRMPWPNDLPFTPWDLADTTDGGALVLDQEHGAWWHLDEHLRLRGSVATSPIGFTPVTGDPIVVTSPARPSAYPLLDEHGAVVHPVSIEPGPGGSVLVLDADTAAGWSTLYCYDADTLRWQTPLQDVVEVVDPEDPDAVGFRYSVLGHDFVYAEAGGPLDAPCLYVADAEGNQVVGLTLDPATGDVLARDDFLPLREWAARALVRAAGQVFYDFDYTAATTGTSTTRWVPLAVFGECRFATTATLTTATDFGGGLPGLVGDTFDTAVPGCVWHRLLLDAYLPTGTSIAIRARASDDPTLLTLEDWVAQPTPYLRSGGSELPWTDPWADRKKAADPTSSPAGLGTVELLFQQVTGRYLQLELTLTGNGRSTPLVRSLRTWYPRFSYVDHYLPAVYASHDGPDRFLERFLATFEGLYTSWEEQIEHTHLILDSRTALAQDLPWLAAWFGLALDPLWDEERRRFLIRHVDRFYRIRGTVLGLVAILKVYLDPTLDDGVFCGGGAGGVRLVERFLTRDTGGAAYGAPPTQPDPDPDPLTRVRRSAHRFDVLVPSDLSDDDTAMVRRIVENAKPAHTAFALRRYHELFVVGQARLGLDTQLGTAPAFVPVVPGDRDAALLAASYLGYPRPFDLPDRVVSDRDRVGSLPAL